MNISTSSTHNPPEPSGLQEPNIPNPAAESYNFQEDDKHPLIKHEESTDSEGQSSENPYKISLDELVSLIQDGETRKFSEEIDKLEAFGEEFFEKALKTDFSKGISSSYDELNLREHFFGHNRKTPRESEGFWSLWWNSLGDFTLRVLILCAILSITVEMAMAKTTSAREVGWIDGFSILLAVVLSSSVQALNDYQKEKQFKSLSTITEEKRTISVYREGELKTLHQSDLLTGDVVLVTEGMDIPCDGLVIEANEILCDESDLTGETQPVMKRTLKDCIERRNEYLLMNKSVKSFSLQKPHELPSPILFSGSRVLQGDGRFLVLVVGSKSGIGRIQERLEVDIEATPLQEKLEDIARGIGKFGLFSAVLIFFTLLIRFGIERYDMHNFDSDKHVKELIEYVLISITVVVVAIPEGLPLSVVLSLAFSVKKMLKDNNLVRRLHACETMGGADYICSDKTGTLTQNSMTFTQFWNENLIELETAKKMEFKNFFPSPTFQTIFLQETIVNSSSYIRPDHKGSSTEIAFLKFIENICDMNYESIRKQYVVVSKFPFNSQRKRMSCIIADPLLQGNKTRLVIKGASEFVLESCTKIHNFHDEIYDITPEMRSKISDYIDRMASQALRTLVLAYKEINPEDDIKETDSKGVKTIEKSDLIFFGLVGIKDILRKEVPQAIQACKKAGIKVCMITGDNKITARAIAKECQIINPDDENSLVLEGTDFNMITGGVICANCGIKCNCALDVKTAVQQSKLVRKDTIKNQEEFTRIYKNIDVIARTRPEDKYAMVVGLKERNHVVAVTGDGTNDAPALKKADVGIAMGISGTEVAREAASLILLDDNFESIVKAIMWGRNIYDNIRKFLQFQLTVNVVAVGLTLLSSAIIKQEIFKPVQMLWINLIMDTFASLALATEAPSMALLDRKPHNRNEFMISKTMMKHIIGQAIYQFAIILLLLFYGDHFLPEYRDSLDLQILKDNNPLTYKYNTEGGKNYVRSGRYIDIASPDKFDYENIETLYGPSRHFTIIFNCFVWMQIFNFLNTRRIHDEINVFQGIHKNPLFLLILFIIIFFQVILISYGSLAFHVYKWVDETTGSGGLTFVQWAICIAFGSGVLFVRLLLIGFSDLKNAFMKGGNL